MKAAGGGLSSMDSVFYLLAGAKSNRQPSALNLRAVRRKSKMHASKIIDEIAGLVAPFMKQHHFRRKKHIWWREYEHTTEIVDLEKSRWNDSSEASFRVNLGLYWPHVHGSIGRLPNHNPPRICECTANQRLGPLFDENRDYWWKICSDTDPSATARDVCEKIERFGFPWLSSGLDLTITLDYARKGPITIVKKELLAELERRTDSSSGK